MSDCFFTFATISLVFSRDDGSLISLLLTLSLYAAAYIILRAGTPERSPGRSENDN